MSISLVIPFALGLAYLAVYFPQSHVLLPRYVEGQTWQDLSQRCLCHCKLLFHSLFSFFLLFYPFAISGSLWISEPSSILIFWLFNFSTNFHNLSAPSLLWRPALFAIHSIGLIFFPAFGARIFSFTQVSPPLLSIQCPSVHHQKPVGGVLGQSTFVPY